MSCPCCNSFKYDENFMRLVQELRDEMHTPFHLTKYGGGFFRCEKYQLENHPETPKSQHCKGKAMDVLTIGWDGQMRWRFLDLAMKKKFSIGIYRDFFHIDARDTVPVTWVG